MKKWIFIFLCVFLLKHYSYCQCPQFYDFDGNLSSSPEWIVCDGNDYILVLQSNVDIGNYSIDWGDGSPITSGVTWIANSPVEHTYTQAVANYTITINLPSASGHIIVPNSFTPNSNNEISENFNNNRINDVFYPIVIGAKSYQLNIYNRWEEHLFQSEELEKGWNGYFKGQLCQQDVYVYKIHVVYYNNFKKS
jgi:gliding motility-associated-like protein